MAGCAKKMKPIAGLANGGIAQPFQETWVERRDRENAINPPAPFQETWIEQRDREQAAQVPALPVASASSRLAASPVTSMGLPTFQGLGAKRPPIAGTALPAKKPFQVGINVPAAYLSGDTTNVPSLPITSKPDASGIGYRMSDGSFSASKSIVPPDRFSSDPNKRLGIAGLADGGPLKRVPGKPNPKVADDVTINAKIGEYYMTPEDVELLGGPDAVDAMIRRLREQSGLPTKTGPKTHGQPDNQGRMDKPGLPSRGIAGLADGGSPWSTQPNRNTDPIQSGRLGDMAKANPIHVPAAPVNYNQDAIAQGRLGQIVTTQASLPSGAPVAPPTAPVNAPAPPIGSAPKLARGMESIAQTAINLDGNKGLGDTTAISNRVNWSPGSANVRNLAVNDKYNEEVGRAGIANAILQGPKTMGQHQLAVNSNNTTWGQKPKEADAMAAANFAAQEKGIADTKDLDGRRYIADAGLKSNKYVADSDLKGKRIAGAAHVQAAEVVALGREAASRASQGADQAKEAANEKKEETKRTLEMAKSWTKSATGMEHPDDIRMAHAYIQGKTNFNKSFDTFMDGLKPQARKFWIDGFKSRDPQVVAELAKRGIVDPAAPQFPSRQTALGGV